MAAKLTEAQITALGALSNIEEQVIYLCQQFDIVQTDWNTANPGFQRRAIELNADFVSRTIAVQLALPLESTSFSASAVAEAFPLVAPGA